MTPTTLPTQPALPDQPFDTYVPNPEVPWNIRSLNHLLRRAAFGPPHDQIDSLLKLTPAQVVDSLLDYEVAVDPYNDMLQRMEGFFNFDQITQVQDWFFFRMTGTPRPAQERMALFWHNHFATSASKVDQAKFMAQQIEMFRQKGLGSFHELLLGVTKDPAMLVWLDGGTNRKGHANENYAREVMELFTLGIGNYTEHDVRELARAFTGWQVGYPTATFNPKNWDDGEKTIFGQTGKYDAPGAIALLLSQPAAPIHLAKKILKEFVHPEPTDEVVNYYAGRILANRWEIKPLLKEIFTSRMFFSEWAYRSRIKSPVELTVGAAIAFGGKLTADVLMQTASRMGQRILFPPNVKGWDGNEAWINSNTVLVRFNYALTLVMGQRGIYAERPDLQATLKAKNITSARETVEYLCDLLCDGNLPEDDRIKFAEYIVNVPVQRANQPRPLFNINNGQFLQRIRDVMHLMMATPEYQLA